jgi:hypothetical protein
MFINQSDVSLISWTYWLDAFSYTDFVGMDPGYPPMNVGGLGAKPSSFCPKTLGVITIFIATF